MALLTKAVNILRYVIPKREAQNLTSRNSFLLVSAFCSIHESQVCQEEKKKGLNLPPFNSLAEGERWCKLSHSLLTELLTLDTTELDCKGKNPCKWQNRKGVSLEAALSFIASLYNYTLPFKATCESCLCSLLLFPRPWGKCIVAIPCQIQTPSDQAFLNMALQWSCWGKEKKGETFFPFMSHLESF